MNQLKDWDNIIRQNAARAERNPQISNDLIEAYKGYYEDEIRQSSYPTLGDYLQAIATKIQQHSPKERLEIYLEWNGILGYTSRIWEITQGEL